MTVNNVTVQMLVDAGASTESMDEGTLKEVKKKSKLQLQPPIFAYTADTKLFVLVIKVGKILVLLKIHVLQVNHSLLFCYRCENQTCP